MTLEQFCRRYIVRRHYTSVALCDASALRTFQSSLSEYNRLELSTEGCQRSNSVEHPIWSRAIQRQDSIAASECLRDSMLTISNIACWMAHNRRANRCKDRSSSSRHFFMRYTTCLSSAWSLGNQSPNVRLWSRVGSPPWRGPATCPGQHRGRWTSWRCASCAFPPPAHQSKPSRPPWLNL